LISTGNSQGLIDEFPHVRKTAEAIATAIGSKGPLNIQGRVRDGVFLPFEINPRFSASTYLRAMAGFNEVDIFIGSMLFDEPIRVTAIRPGYYLRSFSETFIPKAEIKS
jgi:carbamoyl-phosphate synthase large subunit